VDVKKRRSSDDLMLPSSHVFLESTHTQAAP